MFGGLSENVIINTALVGVREFVAGIQAEVAAMEELGAATAGTAEKTALFNKEAFLMRQGLFTMRRLDYGVTLGLIGAGVEAIRFGSRYNSAMQSARAALHGVLPAGISLNKE